MCKNFWLSLSLRLPLQILSIVSHDSVSAVGTVFNGGWSVVRTCTHILHIQSICWCKVYLCNLNSLANEDEECSVLMISKFDLSKCSECNKHRNSNRQQKELEMETKTWKTAEWKHDRLEQRAANKFENCESVYNLSLNKETHNVFYRCS